MTKKLNIIEALSMPTGTKFKVTHSAERNLIGELVVIREFGLNCTKGLFHISRSGSEHKLAATEMMVTTTFEEYQEVEYVLVNFLALAESNNRQVYYRECGQYHALNKYKDLEDIGVRDTDDLQRKSFYEKKVNGVYVTK